MKKEIENYKMFEKILFNSNYIALYGAGQYGRGWCYDVINAAGYSIEGYFDSKVKAGTVIRDGIKVKSIDLLDTLRDCITLFITVNSRLQNEIIEKVEQHGIKNYFLMDELFMQNMVESIYSSTDENIKKKYSVIADDEEFIKNQFVLCTGYELNLENPKTFSEKLQWLKLNDLKSEYTGIVDKLKFKDYVFEKIGAGYTIPTIKSWEKVSDIKLEELPDNFVLKCNHDSGSIQICKNKEEFDFEKAAKRLERCLKYNFYWTSREWPYKNVERKILAEPYMGGDMIDYKLWCFGGKVKMIYTCTERHSEEGIKVTFFDLNWNKLNFEMFYPSSSKIIDKPKSLDIMIELAEKLSENIPFVRVDFYEVQGKVYVGEMTFFPGAGMGKSNSKEWELKLGNEIHLPIRSIC